MDNLTILYVDDEPINLMLFKRNFERRNYKVFTAESGMEGLEKLKENSEIRVVVSDMKMPRMNGIEFIKTARKDFPNIVFFILTGFDFTPEIEDALSTKLIQKYFGKPFDIVEMENAIMESLAEKA